MIMLALVFLLVLVLKSHLTNKSIMDVANRLLAEFRKEPPRLKAIDLFMAFLVAVGVVQFAFCALVGNYPFNAFLGGFAASVGQFVLLAALRHHLDVGNQKVLAASPERAFGDFVFASLLLHFIVYHCIN